MRAELSASGDSWMLESWLRVFPLYWLSEAQTTKSWFQEGLELFLQKWSVQSCPNYRAAPAFPPLRCRSYSAPVLSRSYWLPTHQQRPAENTALKAQDLPQNHPKSATFDSCTRQEGAEISEPTTGINWQLFTLHERTWCIIKTACKVQAAFQFIYFISSWFSSWKTYGPSIFRNVNC